MEKYNFIKYLTEVASLEELDVQILQELTERYPYCQNLHFLRCKKARLEGDAEHPALLSKAATYSTDRSFLFKKLHDDETPERAGEQEAIEMPLASDAPILEDIPEMVPPQKESKEESLISKTLADLNVMKGSVSEAERIEEVEEEEQQITFSGLMFHSNDYMSDQDNLQEAMEIAEEFVPASEGIAPAPKKRFKSYNAVGFGSALEGLLPISDTELEANRRKLEVKLQKEAERRKEKEASRKKTEELVQYAEKSLVEKQDNATETLAGLLALQGHKEKAIAMYEKLKLQIPEKSAYFAAQIEKLKIS